MYWIEVTFQIGSEIPFEMTFLLLLNSRRVLLSLS